MLLGELWWAQSAGAIPGNPLRAFVSVAVAMFLDASGFHAGSFAPALSSRKVHPVYRLLIIYPYNDHAWLLSPEPLVVNQPQSTRVEGSQHCYEIMWIFKLCLSSFQQSIMSLSCY